MNQPRDNKGRFASKPKMPAWMAFWVAALRSGLYDQCTGYLHNKNSGEKTGYCCLGVLCEINPKVEKDRSNPLWDKYKYIDPKAPYVNQGGTRALPPSLAQVLGFHSTNAKFSTKEIKWTTPMPLSLTHCLNVTLASLNDEGWTFDQIADFIEANWQHIVKP